MEETALYFMISSNVMKVVGSRLTIWSEWTSCGRLPADESPKQSAGYRDRDQRLRIYNERLQLIINGNILSAKKPDGKVRLQFLGIRVKEPPAGPYTLGAAGSNMMVSRF